MTGPAVPDSLSLRLVLAPKARIGTIVRVTLRVENTGDRRIELHLRGRTIAFDVVVRRPTGEVVWRRLEGKIVPGILQLRTFEPGEVLELRTAWDQNTSAGIPVDAGEYRVHGALLTDDPAALTTAPVSLHIVRPGE